MAIAYGNVVRGAAFSPGTTLSWSGPSVAGSNLLAVVQIGVAYGAATPVISGVTWGGVAMTEITGATVSENSQIKSAIYILVNPPTGVSTVVVTTTNYSTLFASAAFFTGVNQVTPTGASTTNSNVAGTAIAATLTTTINGDMIVSSMCQDNQNARAVPTGVGVEITAGSAAQPLVWSCGYFPIATAGSTTVTHDSATGVANRILGVVVLHPSAAGRLFRGNAMDGMGTGGRFSNPLAG